MSEPEWELLLGSHWDTTERLAIPGGWLVRSVWRKQIAVGQPHLDGSAIVFVPGGEQVDAVVSVTTEEPPNEEAEEAEEVDRATSRTEPEVDPGIAGQDREPVRKRKGAR